MAMTALCTNFGPPACLGGPRLRFARRTMLIFVWLAAAWRKQRLGMTLRFLRGEPHSHYSIVSVPSGTAANVPWVVVL